MTYDQLNQYRNKVNSIFNNDFKFDKFFNILIGIILMPNDHHFICLFKNNNSILNITLDGWYFHDDLNGYIKYINDLGKLNILNSNNPCLFIYSQKNE